MPNIVTLTNNDPHAIPMDSEESQDEMVSKEPAVNRDGRKNIFGPHLVRFAEQNSGI